MTGPAVLGPTPRIRYHIQFVMSQFPAIVTETFVLLFAAFLFQYCITLHDTGINKLLGYNLEKTFCYRRTMLKIASIYYYQLI